MKLSDIHLTLGKIRKGRELSQQDIAEALNVEQATVSMYENGKRGIPFDLLDEWLQLLEIEVKIIPKGFTPIKPVQEIEDDMKKFNELKKKRNYLIAELRTMMAQKVLQVPEFQKIDNETGESVFWPYSYQIDEKIGLVETRYDHPEQKHMAVEYTSNEVNVYKILSANEAEDRKNDYDRLNINRIYFSEEDFLTACSLWEPDDMEMRKITILRKSAMHPDGVEIIDPEGFSIRTLVEMLENHKRFTEAVKELEEDWKYISMEKELDTTGNEMRNIVLNNRLANGTANPEFVFWNSEDIDAIEVPLAETPQSWKWIEEGVKWRENWL